ncbi:MAG: hypothetical protein Q4P29_01235 [Tissierellia bacterium]|nr:hypothetical protein [Tissierellia bacterium]
MNMNRIFYYLTNPLVKSGLQQNKLSALIKLYLNNEKYFKAGLVKYAYIKFLNYLPDIIFGLFMMVPLFLGTSLMQIMFVSNFFIIIYTMNLVAQFYQLQVLDSSDKNIIMSKAVSPMTYKAYNIYTILHSIITHCIVAIIPLLLIGIKKFGIIFGLIAIVNLVLIIMLWLGLISAIYNYAFKKFNKEYAKDILTFIQSVLTIGFIVVYQILGSIGNNINIMDWNYFLCLFPNAWFSGIYELILENNYSLLNIILIIISIIAPIFLVYYYIKSKNSIESKILLDRSSIKKRKIIGFKYLFAKLFTKKGKERAFFHVAWSYILKDRLILSNLLTQITLGLIFPIINLLKNKDNMQLNPMMSKMMFYPVFIMMSSLAILTLRYSTQGFPKWLYYIGKNDEDSKILKGTFKAYFILIAMPAFLLLNIIIYFLGQKIDIALFIISIFQMGILMILSMRIAFKSQPFNIRLQGNQTRRSGFFGIYGFLIISLIILSVINYRVLTTEIFYLKSLAVFINLVIFLLCLKFGFKKEIEKMPED